MSNSGGLLTVATVVAAAIMLGFLNMVLAIMLVVLLGLLLAFALVQYNRLVRLHNPILERGANIQVEEQRPLDLLENFSSAVVGGMHYETNRLNQVLAAIRTYPVSFVFTLYPELRALQQLRDLGSQIENAENRIARMRVEYNQAVRQYDDIRRTFPTALLLSWRFRPVSYFSASASATGVYRIRVPRV